MKKDIKLIPHGFYCYKIKSINKSNGHMKIDSCPYWSINEDEDEQFNGYCSYMEIGDWETGGLLWDMVKECGENED